MRSEKVQWHPGFSAPVHNELEEYLDELSFLTEFPLSKKPLAADILIIRKKEELRITKNIGRIFRKHNLIECFGNTAGFPYSAGNREFIISVTIRFRSSSL